jgi:hypothetical protein
MCQNLRQGGQMLPGVSLDLYNIKVWHLAKKKFKIFYQYKMLCTPRVHTRV